MTTGVTPHSAIERTGVTTLILVRHGETDWNQVKRIQGQIDIPLADSGVRQAALLATRLEQMKSDEKAASAVVASVEGAADVASPEAAFDANKIAAVLSSDLGRAMQTAAPLASVLGTQVIAHEGLRERHYGVFQAHDGEQIKARWPAAYAQWQSHDPDFAPDDGESLRQFYIRVVSTLAEIARRYPNQTVICVAHGGVLDCAYRFATKRPLAAPRSYLLLNASLNVLAWQVAEQAEAPAQHPGANDSAVVQLWADVAHLAEEAAVRDDT